MAATKFELPLENVPVGHSNEARGMVGSFPKRLYRGFASDHSSYPSESLPMVAPNT